MTDDAIPPQETTQIRRAVVDIAMDAGRQILSVYQSGSFATQTKSDGSFVTRADLLANESILKALRERFSYPVISEELAQEDYETRKDWDRFWLVDPLDGTRDFVERTGDFSVLIALIENRRPIVGVIFAPVRDEAWSAARQAGCFHQKAGSTEVRIQNRRDKGPRTGLVSRFRPNQKTQAFYEGYQIEDFNRVGSAIKFGHMACGAADLFVRLNPSWEWDIAAGDIIAEEAGCPLVPLEEGESRLLYNQPTLKVPPFLSASERVRKPGVSSVPPS